MQIIGIKKHLLHSKSEGVDQLFNQFYNSAKDIYGLLDVENRYAVPVWASHFNF